MDSAANVGEQPSGKPSCTFFGDQKLSCSSFDNKSPRKSAMYKHNGYSFKLKGTYPFMNYIPFTILTFLNCNTSEKGKF